MAPCHPPPRLGPADPCPGSMATQHPPQLAEHPVLAHILMGAQLPRQGSCTLGLVSTHIQLFSLQQQVRAWALVLQEYPVCTMPRSPSSVFWPASLTLCLDICMHTCTGGWRGTNTRCIQQFNLSPALTPSLLQKVYPGARSHQEEGGHAASGALMELSRWEGCSWPQGDQIGQLCLR